MSMLCDYNNIIGFSFDCFAFLTIPCWFCSSMSTFLLLSGNPGRTGECPDAAAEDGGG